MSKKVKVPRNILESPEGVETSALERVGGQHHALAALPLERPGTYYTGAWVGPRAGLDVCVKSRPYRDSTPGPSSP
jgi:hypothetical protein